MNASLPSKPSLSPFVAVAFAVISITGVLLFFHVKNGPIMVLHEWFGWAFVIAGAVHVLLNWRPLLGYLKLRRGVLSLTVALVLVVALGALGWNHRGGPHGRPMVAQGGTP
ncbi:DUF4405 domain-containing protein [Opitutus sp. ER46]|uniref:DUF4405 domain-containing protein n=1 Tax=Opitutus sp. ER46 TaxID=2161864 RepID=UPI000D30151A|nr:DUF4405 domain-containing protein [Opitutus sp. ER46]PTX99079.1 hypothetical protein DB354_03440 [Opitutus sp. ER46]